ncbi:MAG: polysaccharide deacetylase [Chloroflexi bacterium]|nr:polysaccharide deacetylase [Chloroflexota bacterium]
MSSIWPGNTRCAVILTFDLDGVSALLNRDPQMARRPSAMSRNELGLRVGAMRILDLLDRHGLPATFFVPGYTAERNEALVKEIARRGHEIGTHGYLHEPGATLSREQEAEVMDRSVRILEGIAGQRPRGHRSPSLDMSVNTLELLLERDFLYDSSMMAHDAPYFVDTPRGRIVEIPNDWAQGDAHYYTFNRGAGSMNTPEDVYGAWQWEFDGAYQYGSALILNMHPHTTGRLAKLEVLEGLIKHIKGHADVEFYQCIEVARAWTDEGMRLD